MTDLELAMVPLSEVAPDARAVVETFRSNGCISFQDLAVDEAREIYRNACIANGPPREDVDSIEDVVLPVLGGEIMLRVYRPKKSRSGVTLFLHGGGWVIGDLESHDPICRAFVNGSGLPLVAVDYRKAPEYRHPVPLRDCEAALSWLTGNGSELGLDPTRLILFGDSAGANMATTIANKTDLRPGTQVMGQVLLYPVTDLGAESPSYDRVKDGFALSATSMRWFKKQYLSVDTDAADPLVSPLRAAARRQPPMFIVTVGHDPLSDEGIAYADAAARAGTWVEHHHLPSHMHGIFTSAGRVRTGRTMLDRASQFVANVLDQSI